MASYNDNTSTISSGYYTITQPLSQNEDATPKYPNIQQNQEWLEVVPNQSPLYPMPPCEPPYELAYAAPAVAVAERGEGKSPVTDSLSGSDAATPTVEEAKNADARRRILGLTVPVFWALVIGSVIILAAGIGGGVGGGLVAQQQKSSSNASSGNSSPTPTPTTTASATSATAAANAALPSDSGCPLIEGQTYTPYAVNGQPIPFEDGLEGQQFRQQCGTNWVSSAASRTHDILRIFMPTLENCIMTCAEYNAAYRAGLNAGAGVGGGYCVAVTIVKESAGFCYLKNGTATNDTLGTPDVYSSAVLITDTDMQLPGS